MLKSNLQRKQIITILLVLFLFLFMVFTLVLAQYLSERTEQEDASAYSNIWLVEAQCKRPTDLNNLSYEVKLNTSKIGITKTPERAVMSLCINPNSNSTHNYVYQNLFGGNANWKDTTQTPPLWACYAVGTAYHDSDNLLDGHTFQITPSNNIGYDGDPQGGTWHKSFAEFNSFINNLPSTFNRLADYNTSVVVHYTDGTFDDQLQPGTIKGGSSGCYPTATLQATCSNSGTNNTTLSYNLSVSNIYPTPVFDDGTYNDRMRLQLCLKPSQNASHQQIYQDFFGSSADYSSGGTLPDWACYIIKDVKDSQGRILPSTVKWDSSIFLKGNKTIDDLAAFVSEHADNKDVLFDTKVVFRAYGNTNDQIRAQEIKINKEVCGQVANTPTPTPTPINVVERIQPDNFSQVVLNDTGDYFYYRSCAMDNTKDEGVDFTKCKNDLYDNESWTKHSVKSLMIKNGTQLIDKVKSIDVDQREGAWANSDLLRDILYFTVLSNSGDKIYTRSCNVEDNLDADLCTNWTTTNVSDIAGLNLSYINSIENTTYYRNGKYYTFTKILDPISDTQAPGPYSFLSRECQTHPEAIGTNPCSPWVRDSRQEMMNNYKSFNTYVFDTGSGKKIKESFLTDIFGSIENYICDISKTSTSPFTRCERNTANTRPATNVEDIGIPYDYSTTVVIEDAQSISTMVSDLDTLDLPAECRNVELVTDTNTTFPGSIIKVGFNLNTKPAIDDSSQTTITMPIPNSLERVTQSDTIKPNPLCNEVTISGVKNVVCAFNDSNKIYEHFKIKSTVNPGDQIQLTGKVSSSLEATILETTCPNVTFDVVSQPINTPTPSLTPTATPTLTESLSCTKKVQTPPRAWTGRPVTYTVILSKKAPGPKGTVIVRDDISEKMEVTLKPKYCEIKTQDVQASVLGVSDYYAERGSILISIVLISVLSGGATYIILRAKKDDLNSTILKEKPYTAALIVSGVVLLLGGVYFLINKEDLAPSDTPALITGQYLECKIPQGVKRFNYRMKILGVKDDVITNTAEVYTGSLPDVKSCAVDFVVTGPELTETHTPTPTFTPTPTTTPEVENSPTPSVTPSPTSELENSPTPSVTPSPTLGEEASPTPTEQIITGLICGAADVNGDGQFTIVDFGGYQIGFASYYRKDCYDTAEMNASYQPCGGKDTNFDSKTTISDFVSFAQRYKKPSCAL